MGDRDEDYTGRPLYEPPRQQPRNNAHADAPAYDRPAQQHENGTHETHERAQSPPPQTPTKPISRRSSLPSTISHSSSFIEPQADFHTNFHTNFHQDSRPEPLQDSHFEPHNNPDSRQHPSPHYHTHHLHPTANFFQPSPSGSRPSSSRPSSQPSSRPSSGPSSRASSRPSSSQPRWVDTRYQGDNHTPFSSSAKPENSHTRPNRSSGDILVPQSYPNNSEWIDNSPHAEYNPREDRRNYEYEPNSHADILQISDLEGQEPESEHSPPPSPTRKTDSAHHSHAYAPHNPLSSSQRFAATTYPTTSVHVPINETYDFDPPSYQQPNFPGPSPAGKPSSPTKNRNYFVPPRAANAAPRSYQPPPPEYVIHPSATPPARASPQKSGGKSPAVHLSSTTSYYPPPPEYVIRPTSPTARTPPQKERATNLSAVLEPTAQHARNFYVPPQNKHSRTGILTLSHLPSPSSSLFFLLPPSPSLSISFHRLFL